MVTTHIGLAPNSPFLDAIASPSFRFGDSCRISKLCELVGQVEVPDDQNGDPASKWAPEIWAAV